MPDFDIVFQPEGRAVPAEGGRSLMEAASRAEIHINASCGGAGVCGRCRVELISGSVKCDSGPGAYFSPEEYARGFRLACQCFVTGPAEIYIPPESRADASLYATAEDQDIAVVSEPDPLVRVLELALPPPTASDNLGDTDRLLAGLTAAHGLTNPDMELPALLDLPTALRQDGFAARVTLFEAGPAGPARLLAVRPARDRRPPLALAVDIGTTTVWARLVNLATGEIGPSRGDLNGQISFGEDVISRIVFADKGDGLFRLKERVVENINRLLDLLLADRQAERDCLALVVVAGNTTMSHLFTGLSPRHLRLAPYVPAAASWPVLRAAELGLRAPASTPLLLYPAVSSYVGGDIVAGVLASGMYERPELTLFIDVGTNGEIVVGNRDWMTCAACSAGPAFEGGGVKFGMRAAPGAVDQFYFDPASGRHRLMVVGGVKPLGICGSGLINAVAELFLAGVLDPQGKFRPEAAPNLIRTGEDGPEYLLAPQAETGLDRDLTLSEVDVENLIRAKGAMYAGYQTLLEGVGLSMGDLERVIIGGGFGKSLNLANAMAIGFLPELPPEKFAYIGNSSLTGAALAALSGRLWRRALEIKAGLTNFELSETPGYMDYFMASQFLPHTQGHLFPRTLARLKTRPPAA